MTAVDAATVEKVARALCAAAPDFWTAPELSAEEQRICAVFEAAPAAPESWLPLAAYEGWYGEGQVTHRAASYEDDEYLTGCGKHLNPPDWNEWGIGGPLDPGEWPEINCPRCPQPPTVVVVW